MLLQQKNTCDTFNNFFVEKTAASTWQEVFKKIASRCDRSKILDAKKLYRKLGRVITALDPYFLPTIIIIVQYPINKTLHWQTTI